MQLLDLTDLSPTVEADITVYDEMGQEVQEQRKVALNRPSAGQGKKFSTVQQGKVVKGEVVLTPPLDLALAALEACLPGVGELTDTQKYNIIIRTGGFVGPNASLVNACFRLLGHTVEVAIADSSDKRWVADEEIPT